MNTTKLAALREYDNHHKVIKLSDPATGLDGYIAIHKKNSSYPSLGATRLWEYESNEDMLRDALRLSALMTKKSSMAGLPYGGAKAVLNAAAANSLNRKDFLKKYAEKLNEINGDFITGSDVGVSDEDLEVLQAATPYIIGQGVDAGYYTALGVFKSIQTVAEMVFGISDISRFSFAIQGLGKTGENLLQLLHACGATIFISDVNQEHLNTIITKYRGVKSVPPNTIHKLEVDFFSPCALSYSINVQTINELRCRAIVGAANNQLQSPQLADELLSNEIVYVPDYIANAGGFISVEHSMVEEEFRNDSVIAKLESVQQQLRDILSEYLSSHVNVITITEKVIQRRLSRQGAVPPFVARYSGDIHRVLNGIKKFPDNYWVRRGETQAIELFHSMSQRVPAYKDFLKKQQINPNAVNTIEDFKNIPLLSKENYLLEYPTEALCWDGEFAGNQYTIASTSGSTGEPYYFPRTKVQDKQFALTAEMALVDYFDIGKKKTLFIDCFALGVWIGGMFMYQAIKYIMETGKYSLSMITPGADKVEALKAITRLSDKYDQIIIGGYAPLVKDLIDDGTREGIHWSQYSVKYFFAAEGFTEGLRDYVVKYGGAKDVLTSTMNHYGTADLGTMAHETPLSIAIRRSAMASSDLYHEVFSQGSRLPTLAQYLPELYYFEEVDGILACTSRGGMPLVRYNLKDRGGIFTVKEARRFFADASMNFDTFVENEQLNGYWNLPFVYVAERSNFTVSIYSVNIYPDSIRRAVEDTDFEDALTGKFTMLVDYDADQNQYLEINIELKKNIEMNRDLHTKVLESVIHWLNKENSEWRDFYADEGIRHKVTPQLKFWEYQQGEYFGAGGKQKWVKKK